MIGKIKDFVYNFNDALIVLLIVAIAGGILVWRVDEIMAYPEYLARQQRTQERAEVVDFSDVDLTPVEVEEFNDAPEDISTPEDGEAEAPEGGAETQEGQEASGEGSETGSGSEGSSAGAEGSLVTEDVKFTVPSGSSADRIGDLLVQAGLVPSRSDFLQAVKDNNLETRLQAGTFTIPKGATTADIAKIIARQM